MNAADPAITTRDLTKTFMVARRSQGRFAGLRTLIDPVRDWKVVLSLEAALPELYNLGASDPDAANLADAHPRVTLDLLRSIARSPVFPRTADDFDVRDTREQKAAGAGMPEDN